MIPIIDLFAGPGGLGEGFSSLLDNNHQRIFDIKLSIEKDSYAHQTLKLRSFFRKFPIDQVPEEYYSFIKGEITIEDLYKNYPHQAKTADREAWCGTLGEPEIGDKNGLSNEEIDARIKEILGENNQWLLIGGPPCQAYSIVGRSRRKEIKLDINKDKRVGLYKEYLRIIAVHKPAVFVMENVKGLLSAQTEEEYIFSRILSDLSDPVNAYISEDENIENQFRPRYRIYSLSVQAEQYDENGFPIFKAQDFIIKAEDYGIPQKRHRVILLGVREDMPAPEHILDKKDETSLASVIGNLPRIRSGLSREFSHTEIIQDSDGNPKKRRFYNKIRDSRERWVEYILKYNTDINKYFKSGDSWTEDELPFSVGDNYIKTDNYSLEADHLLKNWFYDQHLGGILHHISRNHMSQDLKRYMFAAYYTKINGTFPKLDDYKKAGSDLLPDHENAESGKFTDRFRVQLPNIPATTVTSHISKDGHYFIHYDPKQSRSFTVREAARVQTFPDNYYFCGGRTEQFHQVGNAVPPYLAYQIAEIIHDIFIQNEH